MATHTTSLVEAFERVRSYFRILHQGAAIEPDVNDRHFIVAHRAARRTFPAQRWPQADFGPMRTWRSYPSARSVCRLRPVSGELACAAFSCMMTVLELVAEAF